MVRSLGLLAGLLLAAPALAAESPDAARARFFETHIRPVLATKCQSCHGAANQSSGLRLDSLAALRKGGTRGTAVTPGSTEKSLLLSTLRHAAGVPKMPPNEKLTPRQLANFETWIKQGAYWPESPTPNAQRPTPNAQRHWSLQPVRRPAVPPVKNRAWVATPVDAFILAGLEAKGLKPAPAADRRTLIRRAAFDLTGLPPTPEEVRAFVQDKSPNAWEKVIDRLLASPRYGEKWGRHWLDVARYADSNGMDENVHYGNAWRYRDWVVQAFNQDKPYNSFLVEQIAGDLLPAPDAATRARQLVATGFLAVGPKVISEVDDRKMLMDMIDEQVDSLGRSTMAMTFGCARCHDHKFDPISTKDYYALAGIFKSTKTMEVMKKPRMWFEHSLATDEDRARKAEHEKKVAAQKTRVSAFLAAETAKLKATGRPVPKSPETAFPETAKAELKRLRDELAALEKATPVLPAAMGLTEATPEDLAVHIRGDFLNLGEVVPRRFPTVLTSAEAAPVPMAGSGRLELARWLTDPQHPLTGRVIVNRVWRWHFGQGIVRTPDNFGILGETPSHPELLDWLAATFVSAKDEGGRMKDEKGDPLHPSSFIPHPSGLGWSLKRLHRLIMLSNSYKMSSAYDARAAAADPENRLRWRFDVRRLQAEEIRDALLATSGTLDLAMGGSILPLKNREYVFDHTSKDNTRYESRRRSLYIPIVRNNLYDAFQLFDFGDGAVPEGNRPTTTVAPQALFIMNSELVGDCARELALGLLKRSELDTDGRLRLLYETAFSRPATPAELTRARGLLERFNRAQQAARPEQSWTWLSHTLLASNEFLFLK